MATIKSEYFGRVGYIQISSPKDVGDNGTRNWETISGLDFKFDISKPIGAVCMEAKIAVLGMSWRKIEQYSTWSAEAINLGRDFRIRVFAGYERSGARCIFEGTIVRAMPTMPPNVWLEIIARSGHYLRMKSVSKDFNNGGNREVPFSEYATKMLNAVDMKPDSGFMDNVNDKAKSAMLTLPTYTKPVTHFHILQTLNDNLAKLGVCMFMGTNEKGDITVKMFNRHDTSEKNPIEVSAQSGMIGIPKIDFAEIVVRRLMTIDQIDLRGAYMKVTSLFAMPGMFGDGGKDARTDRSVGSVSDTLYSAIYRINTVRYVGHLRGDEWFTEYKAWRFWKNSDEPSGKTVKTENTGR